MSTERDEANQTETGAQTSRVGVDADVRPLSVTLDHIGTVEREHYDGFDWPGGYDFGRVNTFVHSLETQFEELQYLCLAMATEIERLKTDRIDAA